MAEECVSPEGGTPSFGARRPELVTVDARPERRGAAQPERRSAMVPERRSATRTDRRVATLPARRDDMVTARRSDRPAERLNSAVPEHGIDTLPARGTRKGFDRLPLLGRIAAGRPVEAIETAFNERSESIVAGLKR